MKKISPPVPDAYQRAIDAAKLSSQATVDDPSFVLVAKTNEEKPHVLIYSKTDVPEIDAKLTSPSGDVCEVKLTRLDLEATNPVIQIKDHDVMQKLGMKSVYVVGELPTDGASPIAQLKLETPEWSLDWNSVVTGLPTTTWDEAENSSGKINFLANAANSKTRVDYSSGSPKPIALVRLDSATRHLLSQVCGYVPQEVSPEHLARLVKKFSQRTNQLVGQIDASLATLGLQLASNLLPADVDRDAIAAGLEQSNSLDAKIEDFEQRLTAALFEVPSPLNKDAIDGLMKDPAFVTYLRSDRELAVLCRTLRAELGQREAADFAAMMGEEVESHRVKNLGSNRLQEAKAFNSARLNQVFSPFDVEPSQLLNFASLMAEAVQPSPTPKVVVVAGGPGTLGPLSAASAREMVTSSEVVPVNQVGYASLLGMNELDTARPSGEGALSPARLGRSDNGAGQRLVHVKLGPGSDKIANQLSFLRDQLSQSKVMTGAELERGQKAVVESNLANVTVVVEWQGDLSSFNHALSSHSSGAALQNFFARQVQLDARATGSEALILLQEINHFLQTQRATKGKYVSFSNELQTALASRLARRDGNAELLKDKVRSFVNMVAQQMTETQVELSLNNMDADPLNGYLDDDLERNLDGEMVLSPGMSGAPPPLFIATALDGDGRYQFSFGDNWEAVVKKANEVDALRAEMLKLQQQSVSK